jgi:hypothetical protein
LYNRFSSAVGVATGTAIGTARVRGIEWDNGAIGTQTAVYKLYLFDVTVTAGYDFTSANYDMELESYAVFYSGGGPQVIRLLQGTITVEPEITKISCAGV